MISPSEALEMERQRYRDKLEPTIPAPRVESPRCPQCHGENISLMQFNRIACHDCEAVLMREGVLSAPSVECPTATAPR